MEKCSIILLVLGLGHGSRSREMTTMEPVITELPLVVVPVGWTQTEQDGAIEAWKQRHPPPNR